MKQLYFYSTHKLPNRTTICGLYESGKLLFGASRLSDKDRFSRTVGRDLATAQALKTPIWCLDNPDEGTLTKTFVRKAKNLAEIVRKDLHYKENLQALYQ